METNIGSRAAAGIGQLTDAAGLSFAVQNEICADGLPIDEFPVQSAACDEARCLSREPRQNA